MNTSFFISNINSRVTSSTELFHKRQKEREREREREKKENLNLEWTC